MQEGGRREPFLVFAEESLLGVSGKSMITIEGRKMSALELVTTLWLDPQGWENKPVLLVNHKPLKEATGLDASRKLFSYQELASNKELAKLLGEAQVSRARPGNQQLSGLPKEATEIGLRMAEFESLITGSAFRFVANPRAADAQWVSGITWKTPDGGTTLLSLGALYFFGGAVLRDFAFAILIGTYSSIFIASPIVLWWSKLRGKNIRREVLETQAVNRARANTAADRDLSNKPLPDVLAETVLFSFFAFLLQPKRPGFAFGRLMGIADKSF